MEKIQEVVKGLQRYLNQGSLLFKEIIKDS